MGITFNADEVLKIAEQIERNGARFYRRAVEGNVDEKSKLVLLEMASMEDCHEKTFADMRKGLSMQEIESAIMDPENVVPLYLQAIADGRVFDISSDPTSLLTGQESTAEVFQIAIRLETESIVFYLGIKDMVPEALGKDKVQDIIAEEQKHVVILSNALASLQE
jgi:rubrerythrin